MKIILLGTGTPAPSLKRQSSGYLFEVGEDVIVMDHGPGAHHRLLEAGYKATQVTDVFLTHLHYDHMMDYPRLLLQRWDMGAGHIPEIRAFGPAPLAQVTEKFIGEDGAFAPDIGARINHQASKDVYVLRKGVLPRAWPRPAVREVAPGDVIEGRGWTVKVCRAAHVEPYLQCLCYRLETDAGVVVYSGDNGGVNEDLIELARDCDVLIHMCHFPTGMEPTPEYRQSIGNHMDAAVTAQRAGAKTLVLTHMIALLDQPGVMERLVREISTVYAGHVIIGHDLMEIPLSPTKLEKVD